MEAQFEYLHIACTFLNLWRRFCMLSRCVPTNIFFCIGAQEEVFKSALLVGCAVESTRYPPTPDQTAVTLNDNFFFNLHRLASV